MADGLFSGFQLVIPAVAGGASLVAHVIKNLPPMQETWVWSLGWEDPPEEGVAKEIESSTVNPL